MPNRAWANTDTEMPPEMPPGYPADNKSSATVTPPVAGRTPGAPAEDAGAPGSGSAPQRILELTGSARTEEIGALAGALAKAQGNIKGALKDAANQHLKNKYADLASVWEACRDALAAEGIAVIQEPEAVSGGVRVVTTLAHASGQWMRNVLALPSQGNASSNPAQAMGSAITYGRRYALAAMVGVAPEEDDGQTAAPPNGSKSTNGNGTKGTPAADRLREKEAAQKPQQPQLKPLQDEILALAIQAFLVTERYTEEGTAIPDQEQTMAAFRDWLALELDNTPGLLPVAHGKPTFQGASYEQLANLKTLVAEYAKTNGPPF